MKKTILTLLVLMVFAVPVYAGGVNAGFDNSDADVAVAGFGNKGLCISAINFDATNSTGDVTFYRWNGVDSTEFSADEAAAQTALSTVYESGIATDAVVAYERADGSLAEVKTITGNATTGVITSPAIDFAYKDGDKVYEMEILFTWADVGTAAVTLENDNGLFCVPRGPVGAVITGGTMGYMSGFEKP